MSLHHAAQHLASKGRNGDTTLVHMTKGEVAGLQALAKARGKSLTINPETGLPEAFSLKSLLPMAAGAALTIGSGGTLTPLMAGLMVGGAGTLATGSLKQGLMAGLGAYGGAGLGAGLTAAGTQAAAGEVVAKEAAENQAKNLLAEQTATSATAGVDGVTQMQNTIPYDAATSADMSYITPANQLPASTYNATTSASSLSADQLAAAKANTTPMELASKGFTNLGTEAGRDAFVSGSVPGGAGTTLDVAKYGGAAAAPAIMEQPKYSPPEIKGDSDMGQRYAFEPGYDNTIPGRTGLASYRQVSNEEAKKLYGFAEGGNVQYPQGESVLRMADGGIAALADAPSYSDVSYGMSGINGFQAAPAASGYNPTTGYSDAQTAAMAYNPTPQAAPNQRIMDIYAKVEADRLAAEAKAAEDKKIAEQALVVNAPEQAAYAAQGGVMHSYAQGGISTLGSYSDGGRMLKGPGDGMSDNIPAVIGGKQPARLADGEFVVPADVVSHLGNGSTDAGAKQLYKMMDKIRQARTGRKAQGKQVNPNKFMPA